MENEWSEIFILTYRMGEDVVVTSEQEYPDGTFLISPTGPLSQFKKFLAGAGWPIENLGFTWDGKEIDIV